MAGKFYVETIGKYDSLYDSFVEAETAAKKRAAHSMDVFVLQQIAHVELPSVGAITTVL